MHQDIFPVVNMSQHLKKQRNNDDTHTPMEISTDRLPESFKKTVKTQINTIYVGTVIRIYDPVYILVFITCIHL